MNISVEEILQNEIFTNIKVIAGEKGLKNKVKQISVFDCPCVPDVIERKVLNKGDLFITCLEQFRHDHDGQEIRFYFECLLKAGCAGLLVVTDDRINLITPEIKDMCDKGCFPVILIHEEYPYALIIDTINSYLSFDTFNTINRLKLEKIMYEKLSDAAQGKVLYSIKPTIKKYVRAIFIQGEFNSEIAKLEIQNYYLSKENDIFVRTEHGMIIMISDEDDSRLTAALNACTVRIREFLDNPIIGYSRMFERKDAGKALEEAKCALETAKAMRMTERTYDALSTIQLLTMMRDTQEAEDYYDAYVTALSSKIGRENLKEMILTVENYVANSGKFKTTAEMMSQHENTIRYRINRVKSALNMEEDTVKFNETIAIASKLRVLLGREL